MRSGNREFLIGPKYVATISRPGSQTAARASVRAPDRSDDAQRRIRTSANDLIVPWHRPRDVDAAIETTERPGGLLRSYRRAA